MYVNTAWWALEIQNLVCLFKCNYFELPNIEFLKECMSDSVTNYIYVGDTKISVLIKKTNANECTLSEIFLTEILKSFSAF